MIRDWINAHFSVLDITFKSGHGGLPGSVRASVASLTSQNDLDLRHVFTQVGTFRGTVVAVKHVRRNTVDLTRAVCKEFKLVG